MIGKISPSDPFTTIILRLASDEMKGFKKAYVSQAVYKTLVAQIRSKLHKPKSITGYKSIAVLNRAGTEVSILVDRRLRDDSLRVA